MPRGSLCPSGRYYTATDQALRSAVAVRAKGATRSSAAGMFKDAFDVAFCDGSVRAVKLKFDEAC
jgi:hypothetical protein